MLMPSLFTNSFMDDFFDTPSFGVYKYDAPAQNLMSTDVFLMVCLGIDNHECLHSLFNCNYNINFPSHSGSLL